MLSASIIIKNIYLFANQHIRMISEGSRDTEDWSNDAENYALPSQDFFSKQLFNFFNFFELYFDQINTNPKLLNSGEYIRASYQQKFVRARLRRSFYSQHSFWAHMAVH